MNSSSMVPTRKAPIPPTRTKSKKELSPTSENSANNNKTPEPSDDSKTSFQKDSSNNESSHESLVPRSSLDSFLGLDCNNGSEASAPCRRDSICRYKCGYMGKLPTQQKAISQFFSRNKGAVASSKQRWMVLSERSCKLYYYKSKGDTEVMGGINIAAATFNYDPEDQDGLFTIVSDGQTHHLVAGDDLTRQEWLNKLQEVKLQYMTRVGSQCDDVEAPSVQWYKDLPSTAPPSHASPVTSALANIFSGNRGGLNIDKGSSPLTKDISNNVSNSQFYYRDSNDGQKNTSSKDVSIRMQPQGSTRPNRPTTIAIAPDGVSLSPTNSSASNSVFSSVGFGLSSSCDATPATDNFRSVLDPEDLAIDSMNKRSSPTSQYKSFQRSRSFRSSSHQKTAPPTVATPPEVKNTPASWKSMSFISNNTPNKPSAKVSPTVNAETLAGGLRQIKAELRASFSKYGVGRGKRNSSDSTSEQETVLEYSCSSCQQLHQRAERLEERLDTRTEELRAAKEGIELLQQNLAMCHKDKETCANLDKSKLTDENLLDILRSKDESLVAFEQNECVQKNIIAELTHEKEQLQKQMQVMIQLVKAKDNAIQSISNELEDIKARCSLNSDYLRGASRSPHATSPTTSHDDALPTTTSLASSFLSYNLFCRPTDDENTTRFYTDGNLSPIPTVSSTERLVNFGTTLPESIANDSGAISNNVNNSEEHNSSTNSLSAFKNNQEELGDVEASTATVSDMILKFESTEAGSGKVCYINNSSSDSEEEELCNDTQSNIVSTVVKYETHKPARTDECSPALSPTEGQVSIVGLTPANDSLQERLQNVIKERDHFKDCFNAYKSQNAFLHRQIFEMSQVSDVMKQREERLMSECHMWEAQFQQIRSKYLVLLNDLHSPPSQQHDRETLARMLQDVLYQTPDIRSLHSNGKSYDECGFCISASDEESLQRCATFLSRQAQTKQQQNQVEKSAEGAWEAVLAGAGAAKFEMLQYQELKQLIRDRGVPLRFRSRVWSLLVERHVGAKKRQLPETYYEDLLARCIIRDSDQNPYFELDKKTREQIELDLLRTLPNNRYYASEYADNIIRLRRVLFAFAVHNREVSYCQGLNRLAAIALLFLSEKEAFWCLVCIVEHLMPSQYFTPKLMGPLIDQRALKVLIEEKLPNLHAHLSLHNINITMITFNWFLCLFVEEVPPAIYLHIWDSFLLEGSKVLFRYSLAILKLCEEGLLTKMEFMDVSTYLRSVPPSMGDIPKLRQTAFNWTNPLSSRQIKRLRGIHRGEVMNEMTEQDVQREKYMQRQQEQVSKGNGLTAAQLLEQEDTDEEQPAVGDTGEICSGNKGTAAGNSTQEICSGNEGTAPGNSPQEICLGNEGTAAGNSTQEICSGNEGTAAGNSMQEICSENEGTAVEISTQTIEPKSEGTTTFKGSMKESEVQKDTVEQREEAGVSLRPEQS